KLALRLAYEDKAPPRLMRALAFDDAIDVARPVLSFSPRLSDADLVENARVKSEEHLYAIGRRLKLSEVITDAVVERGRDRGGRWTRGEGTRGALMGRGRAGGVRALPRTPGPRSPPAGWGRLPARAVRDCVRALRMVQRDDTPRQYLVRLIETASANVREML